jgi:hypothetical protein
MGSSVAHHVRTAVALTTIAVAALAAVAPPVSATSNSGTDSRSGYTTAFAATSPFYQKLPAGTPVASNSATLVKSLNKQSHDYYGTATIANVNVNHTSYSPALYVAYNTDPVYNVTAWNCQNRAGSWWKDQLAGQLKGVHIPADMQPDPSSDGSVSIYNPNSDEVVDLWRARKVGGQWQACWGGRITNASRSIGQFEYGYGASASGLSLWLGTIREQELLNGRINHVISLGIPKVKAGSISWPANRTDGGTKGNELSIGQLLRLPASLDIDSLKLSPTARTIARAAQEYGILITETSGSVAFTAENPIALRSNQYSTIFRGRWASQEMAGNKALGETAFPLDKLVALPLNYKAPTTTGPTAAATPTPTSPAAPAATATPTPPAGAAPTSYADSVKKAKPILYWRFDDSGSTAADATGLGRSGAMRGVSRTSSGAVAGSGGIVTYGNSGSLVRKTTTIYPLPAFSVQVWFKTTSTSGGKIVGFENTPSGLGSRYDRSLYLTNSGRLIFGTYHGKVEHVASQKSYNDGAWHMATATQGSGGTRLYVDGALVASGSAKRAQEVSGYWRLGGGNLKNWPSAPKSPYFSGAIDEFAVYHTTLSAATIGAQYAAR